ncbi:hypothetical protein DFH08DRAFT_809879 [Mycena albidolilacea]|uniref:Uncharacterized protein n=1 Tax=Mycena albidolilacea TaxID=1033008 RepID=A0AAD6ZYH1_9AGAR|nr:hypothetical protein DFH08DRAFT_809879 [Mycena albidolilacea]
MVSSFALQSSQFSIFSQELPGRSRTLFKILTSGISPEARTSDDSGGISITWWHLPMISHSLSPTFHPFLTTWLSSSTACNIMSAVLIYSLYTRKTGTSPTDCYVDRIILCIANKHPKQPTTTNLSPKIQVLLFQYTTANNNTTRNLGMVQGCVYMGWIQDGWTARSRTPGQRTFPLLSALAHYKRPASDPTHYDRASVFIGVKAK